MSFVTWRRTSLSGCALLAAVVLACHPTGPSETRPESEGGAAARAAAGRTTPAPTEAGLSTTTDGGRLDATVRAAVDAGPPPPLSDPMSLHADSRDGLLALFSIRKFTEQEGKVVMADSFLRGAFGTDGPGKISQGNKALAVHTIAKEQCLAGLKDVVLQTPEQKELCGAENMVPVWTKGKKAWFCIDIFEFPNKACELPVVWAPPTWDKKICELQGKRLCSDIEWNISCRGDPEGGPDRRYAYGDTLDLDACHTNRVRRATPACRAKDAKTAWETCATETEPSGAYPRCRSRFGVFDQHGNVAEVMMRREGEKVLTQLKGSAWFYRDLAREPDKPIPETTKDKNGAYPDHCNFDPRWHVEDYEKGAWHVNYHLGFRCCKSIP